MQLFKILEILASTKDQQISYLSKLGTSPCTDELALEFDNAYLAFLGNISEKQNEVLLNNLTKIDFIFNEMSNRNINDFWNISSLDQIEWNQIRGLAKDALEYRDSINM